MLSYIAEISKPLKDENKLHEYFMGWCMISGIKHSKYIVYKDEYINESSFNAGHTLLILRNMYTCEAHNELMRGFFKMIVDGNIEVGRLMANEIKHLQIMPI